MNHLLTAKEKKLLAQIKSLIQAGCVRDVTIIKSKLMIWTTFAKIASRSSPCTTSKILYSRLNNALKKK